MAGRLAVDTGPRQHVPGEPSHTPLRLGMPPAMRQGKRGNSVCREPTDRAEVSLSRKCHLPVMAMAMG